MRILSAFLLLVFALSITPKKFLHHVFAKHIDNRYKENRDIPVQLNTSGYHCDNDHLVTESPFAASVQVVHQPALQEYYSFGFTNTSYTSAPVIYSYLRGPPVKFNV